MPEKKLVKKSSTIPTPLVHTRHVSTLEHSILLASCFVMLFTSFFFISSQLRAQTHDTGFAVTAVVGEQPKKSVQETIMVFWNDLSPTNHIVLFSLLGSIIIGATITHLFFLKRQKKNSSG